MSTALKLMDADQFLVWAEGREGTWELADGVPELVRPEMMSRTTVGHDRVRSNIEFSLRQRLRNRCEVFSESVATRVSSRKVRCPDVTVDCGRPNSSSLESAAPTVLFEILSPSTRNVDLQVKPSEYGALPTVQHYVIVEPDAPVCTVWSRTPQGGWENQPIIGLSGIIELTAVGVTLPLAEVYDGLELDDRE